MSIRFNDVSHCFDEHRVLREINLEIGTGEIVCVLGPSGSGKSTLLRLIAGLESVQQGSLMLDGVVLADAQHNPPPEQRAVGLVFQDHVLFPHQTVAENVAFGLSGMQSKERDHTIALQLANVGISTLADRYPHTLSGGQQQRVALARALATDPAVLLLDEPFASADAPLRKNLRDDARRRLKAANTTTLMVTHDPAEAMAMADRIAVLVDGEVVQFGTPEELWQRPNHPFVAATIADLQPLKGRIEGTQCVTAFGALPLRLLALTADLAEGTSVPIGVRPSSLTVSLEGPCVVNDIRFLGDRYTLLISADNQSLEVATALKPKVTVGDKVSISFAAAQAVILQP
ncbi:MAG: ABC transporter ATP-binding protein [Pseudomonadota bacterium]|nr:ABC transporter ATP-binding protein [Pseudomonadota bacterium]MEC7612656.1 ABC transporter ATP-binding protein [Pseudomonadota bacterium]MEC7974777.1 ABC transporter ATP-binding protein [Pseudomonadota bacterium]MEC7995529.1 ABC transporter ATP-binding protein [Pseudomonadota bacterium]MEC8696478.1 ABC transporter ATP-binding protein [Pseudomonadota bacterium]